MTYKSNMVTYSLSLRQLVTLNDRIASAVFAPISASTSELIVGGHPGHLWCDELEFQPSLGVRDSLVRAIDGR